MMLANAAARAGRRGVFLALFGDIYLLIGYSYSGPAVTPAVRHALKAATAVAPLPVYAWGWVAAGAVSVACGLLSPGRKAAGFTAAVIMPTIWALIYLAAWIGGDLPRGWVTAAIFTGLALAVVVVAGMPEPADFKVEP